MYTFDERCLELVRHFLPDASDSVLNALAQEIQDAVERFDHQPAIVGNEFTVERTS